MPPCLADEVVKVPEEIVRAAIEMTAKLSQELKWHVFYRIVKDNCTTLPDLAVLEGLGRGMLALYTDSLSASFGFYLHGSIFDERRRWHYLHNVSIKVSRYPLHFTLNSDS